jgi:hypothetical protein
MTKSFTVVQLSTFQLPILPVKSKDNITRNDCWGSVMCVLNPRFDIYTFYSTEKNSLEWLSY